MSIRLRLLLAGLLILPLFLGLTAWMLDRAFNRYQLQAQRESMRLQQLLLARAADFEAGSWRVDGLDEARFAVPDSGLYAYIAGAEGELLWGSPSAEEFTVATGGALLRDLRAIGAAAPAIGDSEFAPCLPVRDHFCFGQRVAWGSAGPEALFVIVEDSSRVDAAREAYRGQLAALCAGVGVLLLLAQLLVVRWGLRPLREVAETVGRLERGEADRIGDRYPAELRPLTDNLRHLLASERQRRERVRSTMDRLAHVLKSPLMLILNSSDEEPAFRALVREQGQRMLGIVEGELARARLDGRPADIIGRPVPVRPVIERIAAAYARLPRLTTGDAAPVIDISRVEPGAVFRGDERDLQDLFGTLLENALKYASGRIEASAAMVQEAGSRCLRLQVADDGDGIPAGLESAVLERGARADTIGSGQGLGLSIVIGIVSAYGGSLHTGRSALGGAQFTVTLPQG